MVRVVPVGRPEDWIAIDVLDMRTFTFVPGPVLRVTIATGLLIAHTADGRPRAIAARCPHRGFPLAEFARHGSRPGTIVCAAHRCEFDVETGLNLTDADQERLATWPLVSEGDAWCVRMDDVEGSA